MCSGLSLSLGALPWGVWLLALWKRNSGSQLRSGESGEGIQVLAKWAEAAVGSPPVSVRDEPRGLPTGRALGRQGLLQSKYPTAGKGEESGEGEKGS